MEPRILIVSPVRNEVEHIERVVRAVAAQDVRPQRWLVIDDASTDGTLEVLQSLVGEVPFMEVLRAPVDTRHAGARDRLARAAAPRNFNAALASADWREYTHIMKLDGDIELAPSYLRLLLGRFSDDPKIGLAGGVLDEPAANGTAHRIPIPSHHVHGALKCYSRECFEAIGGVREQLGWDTVDETYARMHGFRTVTFRDLVSIHHRPWGTADGALRGRARHGETAYITHYTPLWVTLRAFKIARNRPRGLSGLAFLFGYVRGAARRVERIPDPAYRRFTRRELRQRMLRAVNPMRASRPTGAERMRPSGLADA
jgi:glycosyltransferase involved in cell wall biosynthesis